MAPDGIDPLEAGLRIAAALEASNIRYALGGALAYGLWGIPRATVDVDVNLFVDDSELESALDALSAMGIPLDREMARQAAKRDGLIVLHFGPYRLDLFTPSTDFSWEAARTRVRHTVEGKAAWFLSAEAIAVFKLLFFRAKDLVDLERLVAVQGDRLNVAYVRDWIVRMMGETDERVVRWDEMVSAGR